jgi:leucyl-tRNA synthetase
MQGYQVLFPMAFHYTGTPILAMSERIESGDMELIDTFTDIYKVPRETIPTLTKPIKIAKYFHQEIKAGMKEIGYSIDWRREFTTIDPQYSTFIQWQFNKLRDKNLITRGSHPVGWCPKDGSPVGQHDTLGDVEPEIGEYTLIKFRLDDYQLPTATLRPETVFGVTNIWIRPEATYVKADVDGEPWIISREAAEKLQYLSMKITIKEEVKGSDLVGNEAENPLANTKILILPASFVNPKNGTGIVMSVPAHAPYDYQALKDLAAESEILKKHNISQELVESIKIPVIITSKGYSGIPSEQIIEKMKITDQNDPKLEDATVELYRHEFHIGEMAEGTGRYRGLPVSKARDAVKDNMLSAGTGYTIYEILNRPVVCRCGTECLVKIFENQWFIDYGDQEWKNLARRCLEQIKILPEDIRSEFEYTVGWLKRKACARKSGLGTNLPWDEEWVIESLSDSVIYMAYYLISKYVNTYNLKTEQLGPDVFDYILLGEGNSQSVAEKNILDEEVLKQMREEFEYFYPLDSRHSGRDLVPNHLTFFIFNHSAIFPEKYWPRQIVVNGSILMEGKKMSKSFGNIIPLRDAVKTYGADPLRLAILATAELLQDADLSLGLVKTFRERLERLYDTAVSVIKDRAVADMGELRTEDRWIISRLQRIVEQATDAINRLRVREALHNIVYQADQDAQWYLRRSRIDSGEDRAKVIAEVTHQLIETRVRLLAPFAPFISEEIWELMGHKDFISAAGWPKADESKIDIKAEEGEELVKGLLDDTLNIVRVTKIKPSRVVYYTSYEWKWMVYLSALQLAGEGSLDTGSLMKELMENGELKSRAKEVSAFVKKLGEEVRTVPSDMRERRMKIGILGESGILEAAKGFLGKELGADVSIYGEDDSGRYDPKNRAGFSKPYRPAIYVE